MGPYSICLGRSVRPSISARAMLSFRISPRLGLCSLSSRPLRFCTVRKMFEESLQGQRKVRWHERRRFQFASLVVVAVACLLIGIAIGHSTADTNTKSSSTTSDGVTADTTASSSGTTCVPKPERPMLLLTGDSLTEFAANPHDGGWVTLLEYKYARAVDIANRGYAGFNTKKFIDSALPIIVREIKSWLSPAFITVWLGANDASAKDGRHGFLALTVDEYKTNMITIIKTLREAAPRAKLLVITSPTVDADQRRDTQEAEGDSREPPDRTNEHTALYVEACREAAKSVEGVALLDMYEFFMTTYPNATDRRPFFLDGLHFNAAGYKLVSKLIDDRMRTLLSWS